MARFVAVWGLVLCASGCEQSTPAVVVPPQTGIKKGDFVVYRVGTFEPRSLRLQALEVAGGEVVLHVSSPEHPLLRDGVIVRIPEWDAGLPLLAPNVPALSREVQGPWKCHRYEFDKTSGDGPRGSGCVGSTEPGVLLGDGVVSYATGLRGGYHLVFSLLDAGNEAPSEGGVPELTERDEWAVSTTAEDGGVRLARSTRFIEHGRIVQQSEPLEENPNGPFLEAGKRWSRVDPQFTSLVALRPLFYFAGLLEGQQGAPPRAKPGPLWTAGASSVETVGFDLATSPNALDDEPETRPVLMVAKPKQTSVPFELRYGYLERTSRWNRSPLFTERLVRWGVGSEKATELTPKVGDFVDYDVDASEAGHSVHARLRLQLIETSETSRVVQVSSPDVRGLEHGAVVQLGVTPPSFSALPLIGVEVGGVMRRCHEADQRNGTPDEASPRECGASDDPLLAAGNGLVRLEWHQLAGVDRFKLEVAATGSAEVPLRGPDAWPGLATWDVVTQKGRARQLLRTHVAIEGDLIVTTVEHFVEDAGKSWKPAEKPQVTGRTLVHHLARAVSSGSLWSGPVPKGKRAKWTQGEHVVEVLRVPASPALVLPTEPETMSAPLEVRGGVLEVRGKLDSRVVVDWK